MTKKEKQKKLTPKQEGYCQDYILTGRKSASYKKHYDCSRMKPESINRKAFELHENVYVAARIDFLQEQAANRSRLTQDKIIDMLSIMAGFDPADSYDEHGALLPVADMPIANRMMLAGLEVDEYTSKDLQKTVRNKKIKHLDRHQSIDKLLRIFGAYEKDNKQKRSTVSNTIDVSKLPTDVLLALKKAMQNKTEGEK